jgi:hypothetical protein
MSSRSAAMLEAALPPFREQIAQKILLEVFSYTIDIERRISCEPVQVIVHRSTARRVFDCSSFVSTFEFHCVNLRAEKEV